MSNFSPFDHGRKSDWSLTSTDYARFRPGPPDSLYEKLGALGIGTSGQRVLDLGTGTGVLARKFASQGCLVVGSDIAAGQILVAHQLARDENLNIEFRVCAAEKTGLPSNSFDVITASQCWFYFDITKIVPEVRRLLAPGGLLVTTQFNYMPRLDHVAKATEELILKFNPQWTGGDWDGVVSATPHWVRDDFVVRAMFYYDEAIPFTRESWRGRIRACRGVAASLSESEVQAFDLEHEKLLEQLVPEHFTITHRIDAHILQPV